MNQELIERPSVKNEQLGQENRANLGLRTLDMTGLRRPEIDDSQYDQLGECMIGYLEGCRALDDFKNYRQYLDKGETSQLLEIENTDASSRDKNYYLMQIHDRVLGRAKGEDKVSSKGTISDREFTELKHTLKTGYIMNLNEEIADYIDSANNGDNKIGKLRSHLASKFAYATSYFLNKDIKKLTNLDTNFDNKENLYAIFNVIEGMRHEAAFKELIYEIPEDLFEVVETGKGADSHGVDLILKSKISKQKTSKNQYGFASPDEIKAGDFIEMDLPMDIKSTEDAAARALFEQLSYRDHWVMWSHIYREDFRLSMEDGFPDICYTPDESPVYLKYDEQIAAMRNLSNIRYFDSSGERFKPASLDARIEDIKKEVLLGINTLYSREGKNTSDYSRALSA
jgi:hypothetical protein